MSGDTSGVLQLASNNGTTAVTIDTSQNVGIGTTSPNAGAKLTVAGGVLATNGFSSTSASSAGFDYNAGNLRLFSVGSSGATQGGYSFVAKGADGSQTTPMTIDSSGNVGIGTTPVGFSNNMGLNVGVGAVVQSVVSNQALFSNNAYYAGSWKAVQAQTGYAAVRPGSGAGVITFHCSNSVYTAGASLPNMDGSDIKLTIYPSGNIGAPNGSNIYNASDVRLKKNIQTLTKGLDTVIALKPVSFNWITDFCSDENDKTLYGFVAQDTKEVDEHLVEGFNKGGSVTVGDLTVDSPMRVNEKFIIPILTKAIQELKVINDTQAETLTQQTEAINALTARVVALEAK
jgi:hypothetical protein